MNIKVKKLYEDAILPATGSLYAAGYDAYAYITEGSVVIRPHETRKIGIGLSMQPPAGYWVGVYARSGFATKQGLRPANCVGVIDPEYLGEYIVALYNDSNEDRIVRHGDRIAQLVLHPRYTMEFTVVDDLEDTERGTGGFGSTGN